MEPEDVGHVLRRFQAALVPRGLMLDLQVIRPHPVVEIDGKAVCEIDGSPLFATADPAAAAVDGMVEAGFLGEEAVDDHDVLKHYSSGAELVDDFEDSPRNLPAEWVPRLRAIARECVVRERCRTRRLRSRIGGTDERYSAGHLGSAGRRR
jgi:hypothetical protein